jgi:hypothetical protein
VTLKTRMRWGTVAVVACAGILAAGDKKDKAKPASTQQVDSGAFGVFIRGQRVITETFRVEQDNGVSIVKSRLTETGGSDSSSQKSELETTGSGELLHYEWDGRNGSLVVTPKDEFLLEKVTNSGSLKPAEKQFLMPTTSAILDNNFFVQREVLAWRYLATDCYTDNGNPKFQQGPVEFGVLVPQDQTSMPVRMELVGRENIKIRGTDRELLRLNLRGETFSWVLWVDDKDQFKLIRVLIANDIEVVWD